MNRYFIIGAGLSGLRIGQLLAEAGKKVDIFEMDNEVGGLMKTEKRDNFLFDIGPHIFFRDYAEEYRRLIGNDFHNIKILYGIGFNGKDIISPIRPSNLLKNLTIKQSLPLVWDVLLHKLGNNKRVVGPIDNAEKWVISNFGKEVYKYFFKDYISKVMGLPAARVTEDWGIERHKFYKEHNLWQKSLKFFFDFFLNKENKGGYLDVYYPEYGAQQIPEAIYKVLQKFGCKVHLRTTVDKIEVHDNKVTGVVIKKHNREEKIIINEGSVVVNTMPITNLFNALRSTNGNINDVKKASGALSFRSLWLFNLIVNRERLKDKAQIYFPEAKYIFKRVYEPKNLLERPMTNGKTAICVEVCYNDGDVVESMGERGVYSQVMTGLRDFYNISEKDVLDMWSKKVPFAYSIYEIGYKEQLKALAEYLINLNNLVSFGRQGSFRYNHMTNRVMDSCSILYKFLESGKTKKEFLTAPDPKSDFF